jgi:GTP-binding protein HflX
LIAAFRSTLQETKEADLILHLIDASDPDRWQRVRQVNAVLKELDADQVPQIRVYNKIDKLDRKPRQTNNRRGEGRAVWLSAVTGEGIPLLPEAIGDRLRRKKVNGTICLKPSQGRLRAVLFELGAVQEETALEDGGWGLELSLGEREFSRLLKREKLPADILERVAITESSEIAEQS